MDGDYTKNGKKNTKAQDSTVAENLVNIAHPDKTRDIAQIVKYALISTHVRREIAPLSLMLIAPPEQNKTRILLKFSKIPNVEIIENVSAKPLDYLIVKQDQHQEIYHLIILDFIRTLQHKSVVVSALMGTLLNLIDEGCKESLYYGQKFKLKNRIQMGIITGITPQLFRKHFAKWTENGFTTRFLPISYEYSQATRNEVMNFISHDLPKIVQKTTIKIKSRGHRDISINEEISSAILFYTDRLVERLKTFHVRVRHGLTSHDVFLDMQGFRLQKMLRLLAKSIAYDNGHETVTFEDLNIFKQMCDLIALPDNPKEI